MTGKIRDEDLEKITEAFKYGNNDRTLVQLQVAFEVFDHFKVDVAVTGESGSGKSSLINALRGLDPADEEAAPTGPVETTVTPTMYQHLRYPDVRLWDLPGMGTPSFTSRSYMKMVNFDLFDMFIIVASERMKENNLYLVDEILKRQKPFYFVRTKVDNDLQAESKRRNFRESCVLEKMRRDCVASLESKIEDPQVFLISAFETEMYDFMDLSNSLENTLPQLKKRAFCLFLADLSKEIWTFATPFMKKCLIPHSIQSGKLMEEDLGKIKDNFRQADLSDGAMKVQATLSALDHFKLDVAVIGETGSGTSSFINALRGLKNSDQGAAPTGAPGTTKEPTMYPHPRYPHVRLWDVPRMEEIVDYSKDYDVMKEINQYDFYLIVVSEQTTPYHIQLSQIIAGLKKSYYFVQLKTDSHLQDQDGMYRCGTGLMERIRENCTEEPQKAEIVEPRVFLVSSFHRDLYDFADLEETLHKDLPAIRKHAFVLYVAKLVGQEEWTCRIL